MKRLARAQDAAQRRLDAARRRHEAARRRVDDALAPKRRAVARAVVGLKRFTTVQLILTAWRRFVDDDSFALAGYLAYTGLLSFFPFLIFLVMSGSFLVGREPSIELVGTLFALAPAEVSSALQPIFIGIIESKTGVAAMVSALVGLWAGSNAFEAARIGFNKAYDVREDRPFMRRRLQSLTLAAAAASVFVAQSILIVLWPLFRSLTPIETIGAVGLENFDLLRYVIGLPIFALLLTILHTTLPRARRDRFQIHVKTEHNEEWTIPVLPGVLASTALWFLGATAFSLYLRFAPSFAGNYGAMAGVVITLLFFYMSSVIIFFGAQINIAREELRRNRSIHAGEPAPSSAPPA